MSQFPTLQIISNQGVGKRLKIQSPVIVGRASDCDMIISDNKISRHHMIVRPENGNLVVRDLGSKNGVFLNGRRIKDDEAVNNGDVLLLGETFLSVFVPKLAEVEESSSEMLVSVSTEGETHFDEVSIPDKLGRENLTERDLKLLMEVLAVTQSDEDKAVCRRRVSQRLLELFHADSIILCLTSNYDFEPAIVFSKKKKTHFLSDILQATMMQRKGILINNAKTRKPVKSSGKSAKKMPLSQMCVPFIHHDQISGLLALGSKRPFAFNKSSLNLLTVLANQLAPDVAKASRNSHFERIQVIEKDKDSQPLIGESESIRHVRHLIQQVASQPVNVLITGETGSGKELIARELHNNSLNPEGPFVTVNCASIPHDIFEAELFGYEKGAFTGAYRSKPGRFELAVNGTLFLDEIGELPVSLQAKLLRVLETNEFTRLGGSRVMKTNARFLFATNRNLEKMVKDEEFREDLFFRINTFEIKAPPLRDHMEDIPQLADCFLEKIQSQLKRPRPFRYSSSVLGCFLAHDWPGNVRELRNILEQMAVLSDSEFLEENLLPTDLRVGKSGARKKMRRSEPKPGLLTSITDLTQKQLVVHALKEAKGQKKQAAKILGISRPTLDKKIRLFNISSKSD